MSQFRRVFLALLLVTIVASMVPATVLAADDWDVPGGHFFSQTGGGSGKGYSVVDDGQAKFWSEFKRFGGVNAVGYPASRRFSWEGFTVQVFQRVIFQWHADTNSVQFVNTFDRLHDLGKDDWLLSAKQTPKPTAFDDQGKTWDQIVALHLAVLDAQPAIKAKFYAVVGDPIQANGLPTSTVTDEGNHWAVRAQRVEFQLWKQDVPWAKAGTVTVALGGDIVKEAGILPDAGALQPGTTDELAAGTGTGPAVPTPAPTAGAGTVSTAGWLLQKDGEKSFMYPNDWTAESYTNGHNYVVAPDENAWFRYIAAFNFGPSFNQQDFLSGAINASRGNTTITFGARSSRVINGHSADIVAITFSDGWYGDAVTIASGGQIFFMEAYQAPDSDASYAGKLQAIINSYTLLR